jgi:hypothetical protein
VEFACIFISIRYITFSYEDGRGRYTERFAWVAESGAYVGI